jgi:tetratricopeptide (TPR) repeat protein
MRNKEGLASDYDNLGDLARLRGDLEQEEELYRKGLELNEEMHNKEGLASDYDDLGDLARLRGDLEQAEELYRKALAINEEMVTKKVSQLNLVISGIYITSVIS